MKLQKRYLRTYKDKDYFKYMLNVPPEIVDGIGLKEDDELDISIGEDQTIIIKKKAIWELYRAVNVDFRNKARYEQTYILEYID